MKDEILISKEEYTTLNERIKKLATEKSYLQVFTHLMNEMSTVSGLENTIQKLLQIILENIGGSNLIIYYLIDEEVYLVDALGEKRKLEQIEDEIVKKVFETKEPVEYQTDFKDTKLIGTEFTKASTWVYPLIVGTELIGIIKIESLYTSTLDLHFHLPTFFGYAAHILKNEILGHSKLKAAFDQLTNENNLRKLAEEKLRVINEELESLVDERTNELHHTNLILEEELAVRQHAEQHLEYQYTLLSALINSPSDIIIFSLDKEYCYTAFNEKHREEMKKIWNADVQFGMNLLECMQTQELRELAKQSMDRAFKGEAFTEIQHQTDSEIYYELNWNPVFQNDEVVGITAFIRDISDRKRTEQQILKLNRIYAVLSNINQTIVRIHDTKELLNEVCRIAVENGKFRMVWVGFVNSVSNKVDVVASDGFTENYLEKINIDLNDEVQSSGPTGQAIRTGKFILSNNIEKDETMIPWQKDAEEYGYKSSASFPLIVFDKVVGALSIYADTINFFEKEDIDLLNEMAKDISFALEYVEIEKARRGNEELLKQSEVQLKEAQRIAKIGSWELDIVNNILLWSDEIYRIFEIDPNKFGASYQAFLDEIHPEDRDAVNNAYTNSLKAHTPYSIGHRLLFPDGRLKYVHEQCETFYDEFGNPLRSVGTVQDVTERKRTEEALAASELELRNLAESSPGLMGTFYLRPDNSICMPYTSPQIQNLFGLRSEDLVEDATPLLARTHPDDVQKVNDSIAESARTMTPWRCEYRIIHPTRGELWMEGITNPKPHPKGGIIWYGFVHDITVRKNAEQRIALMNFALNHVNEAAFLVDENARFNYVNEDACRILGYTNDELLKMRVYDIDPDFNKSKWASHWKELKLNRSLTFEGNHKTKNGRIFPVEINANYLEYNGNPFNMSLVRDISERKRVEAELREQMDEINRFNKLMIGREEKMIELKKEINMLLEKEGKPKKYDATSE
jgi:PAS domain S-box-containing protein